MQKNVTHNQKKNETIETSYKRKKKMKLLEKDKKRPNYKRIQGF